MVKHKDGLQLVTVSHNQSLSWKERKTTLSTYLINSYLKLSLFQSLIRISRKKTLCVHTSA